MIRNAMYRFLASYAIMNSVGCVGATLSPGLICRKSPNKAAFFQTASLSWPSMTGGASSFGIRTGESFATYLGPVGRVFVFTAPSGAESTVLLGVPGVAPGSGENGAGCGVDV